MVGQCPLFYTLSICMITVPYMTNLTTNSTHILTLLPLQGHKRGWGCAPWYLPQQPIHWVPVLSLHCVALPAGCIALYCAVCCKAEAVCQAKHPQEGAQPQLLDATRSRGELAQQGTGRLSLCSH